MQTPDNPDYYLKHGFDNVEIRKVLCYNITIISRFTGCSTKNGKERYS